MRAKKRWVFFWRLSRHNIKRPLIINLAATTTTWGSLLAAAAAAAGDGNSALASSGIENIHQKNLHVFIIISAALLFLEGVHLIARCFHVSLESIPALLLHFMTHFCSVGVKKDKLNVTRLVYRKFIYFLQRFY